MLDSKGVRKLKVNGKQYITVGLKGFKIMWKAQENSIAVQVNDPLGKAKRRWLFFFKAVVLNTEGKAGDRRDNSVTQESTQVTNRQHYKHKPNVFQVGCLQSIIRIQCKQCRYSLLKTNF